MVNTYLTNFAHKFLNTFTTSDVDIRHGGCRTQADDINLRHSTKATISCQWQASIARETIDQW